jgi:hypothetical protein
MERKDSSTRGSVWNNVGFRQVCVEKKQIKPYCSRFKQELFTIHKFGKQTGGLW